MRRTTANCRRLLSGSNQGAPALAARPERSLRGKGRYKPIDVARSFALFRLLHLEQVGRVDFTAIVPDASLAEAIIVRRHFLHKVDDVAARRLRPLDAELLNRFQVVPDTGIVAGLAH